MPNIHARYTGGLRTESTHLRSGNTIITDAPTDNNGRGEAFSPTDLVCASLATCMMTTMGILAEREGVELKGLEAEIIKVMTASPRKIGEIQIRLSHPHLNATAAQKEKLIHAARTCPVSLSLADSVLQTLQFDF